mmetsp:Transcript_18466/g.30616  ORF Transcript_18466/g.30616 Transcript_18466/m.30616 type:complete len:256 (-) Transcript_18466:37-804(-)
MRPILFLLCILGSFASGFSSNLSNSPSYSKPKSIAKMPPYAPKSGVLANGKSMAVRGGELKSTNDSTGEAQSPLSPLSPLSRFIQLSSSLYGTGGVMYILIKAIRRVYPIALEPFAEGAIPMTQLQLGAYIATCLWFAYVEGYKGFQTKFAPLVVSRSLTIELGLSKIHHLLLAPLYSMGLFHATKKRMIVSWSVSLGVAAIVVAVKKLPYPWRNIIDAGVVAGLSWGCLSILLHYIKALVTGNSPADPALPKKD